MAEELVPAGDKSSFALLRMDANEAAEIIRDALGGDRLSAGDLDRIKVPSGGGTTWEVPSLEGDVSTKNLDGVIVHIATRRAYWPYTMEDRPDDEDGRPHCQSNDGEIGIGNPGGPCIECPFNEFGTDIKGGPGKACKETRQVFLLTANDIIPFAINIPPASLANIKAYRLRLARAQMKPTDVVTRLALTKEKNSRGTQYARVELSRVATLDGAARERMRTYADLISPAVRAATARDVDQDDVE